MDTFSINIQVDSLIEEENQFLKELMKKLLLVIKSMNSTQQIPATRKYIDLWYQKYGTKNKPLIEIYFKSKKSELR